MPREPRRDDLAGQKFGRLTVLAESQIRGRRRVYWRCACECGVEKWVINDALKNGATRSCGCLNDEKRRETLHGGTVSGHSPEYVVWHAMKQRCTNKKNKKYARYGLRGITVCDQWLDDFGQFYRDMGPRPPGTTIERIDNDAGYAPGNCRWATKAEQNRNHSRNRKITFDGETMLLVDWSKRTGIPYATLHARLQRWPVDRALTTPARIQP